jgi:hypothetical protein
VTASAVLHWTDKSRAQGEWTALCPSCGIDAVIGDAAGFGMSPVDEGQVVRLRPGLKATTAET